MGVPSLLARGAIHTSPSQPPVGTKGRPTHRLGPQSPHLPRPCSHPVLPQECCVALRSMHASVDKRLLRFSCVLGRVLCVSHAHNRERGPLPPQEEATETGDGSKELGTERKAQRASARKAGGLWKLKWLLIHSSQKEPALPTP